MKKKFPVWRVKIFCNFCLQVNRFPLQGVADCAQSNCIIYEHEAAVIDH